MMSRVLSWPARERLSWVGLALVVVAYGNAKAWWDLAVLGSGAAGSLFGVAAGVLISAALAIVAWAAGLGIGELGLEPRHAAQGIRLGLKVGLLVSIGAAAALVLSGLAGNPELTPAARTSWPELARRIVLLLGLDTVLPEELAFRGVLFGLLIRVLGSAPPAAASPRHLLAEVWHVARSMRQPVVLVSAIPFALWHVVVVEQDGAQDWPIVVGKLVGVYLGGLFFGSLRLRAGHLAASAVAHWLFDAAAFTAARLASG